MNTHFRPEFLNRIDDTAVFRRLTRADLRKIVDIRLEDLRALLAERGVRLEVTDAVLDALAEEGYDPVYGARPLRRLLQRELETALGRKILAGEIPDRSRVVVDFAGGGLGFRTEPGAEAA